MWLCCLGCLALVAQRLLLAPHFGGPNDSESAPDMLSYSMTQGAASQISVEHVCCARLLSRWACWEGSALLKRVSVSQALFGLKQFHPATGTAKDAVKTKTTLTTPARALVRCSLCRFAALEHHDHASRGAQKESDPKS